MSKCSRLLIVILSFCVAAPASADMFTPSHSCSKPHKPYQFDSEWELENFKSDVETYKRCISDFVDEQRQAIRMHQNAAEGAIDEWNRYVNYELN